MNRASSAGRSDQESELSAAHADPVHASTACTTFAGSTPILIVHIVRPSDIRCTAPA